LIPNVFPNEKGNGPIFDFRKSWNATCRKTGQGYEKEPQYKAVIMQRLGLELEAPTEAAAETMTEFAERSLNEDESSAAAESSKAAKPAAIENPDLFDIIRVDEAAAEAEESKEAIVIEQ
jgi:hypothetical protein